MNGSSRYKLRREDANCSSNAKAVVSAMQLQRLQGGGGNKAEGRGALQQISAIHLPFVRVHYSIYAVTPVIPS